MTAIIWRNGFVSHSASNCPHQPQPDTPALVAGTHIDRILDGKTVRRAAAVGRDIGVADDGGIRFRDEIHIAAFEKRAAAARHLFQAGRVEFEGRSSMQHMMRIDLGDRAHVLFRASTDGECGRIETLAHGGDHA